MKLLDKIKNAIFEDDEFEEKEVVIEESEKPVKIEKKEDVEVVKKIDIEKTIPKRVDLPELEFKVSDEEEEIKEEKPVLKREHRRTPVIFDEEDFIVEEEKMAPREVSDDYDRKHLYGGYKDDKPKEKFKPSPVLSPVYGYVGVSPVLEQPRSKKTASYNELYEQDKKDAVTIDKIRQKAYGVEIPTDDEDNLGLLYDMKNEEKPAISKITIGDAEEYFEDLGLEYNVDYKDSTKAKEDNKRTVKINEMSVDPGKSFEEDNRIELPDVEEIDASDDEELEITKEQLKPKSAEEIKKVKKITDLDLETEEDKEEPEEKNLYDLIDMMYESKE